MPTMLETCNELGAVALEKGDYKEARKHFRYMVKESQKYDAEIQSGAYNRLGLVCHCAKQYEEAELAFRSCLALVQAIYGPSHPETAAALGNLACSLWKNHGRTVQARALLEEAALMMENAMPFESEISQMKKNIYAKVFDNFASLLANEWDYQKAEKYYRLALEIKFNSDEGLSDLFRTVHALGDLLLKQNKVNEYRELSDRFMPLVTKFAQSAKNSELDSLLQQLSIIGRTAGSHY